MALGPCHLLVLSALWIHCGGLITGSFPRSLCDALAGALQRSGCGCPLGSAAPRRAEVSARCAALAVPAAEARERVRICRTLLD